MRYIMFIALLFSSGAWAMHDQVQQQVLNSPAMAMTCDEQIDYHASIVQKYLAKGNLTNAEQIKLEYFQQELDNWINYCAQSTRNIEALQDEPVQPEVSEGPEGSN